MIRSLLSSILLLSGSAFAVEPFLAPAVPSGTLAVQLVPTEAVTPGSTRLVTFGVPFPRAGSARPTVADRDRSLWP